MNDINLDEITILNDIRERLSQITLEDIAACNRRLEKACEHDKVVGTITKSSTMALWTLGCKMSTAMAAELVSARQANDEKVDQSHQEQAAIYDEMEDVLKDMFWAQARSDVGFWKNPSNVGIRQGWVLVDSVSPEQHLGQLLRRISGKP